MKVAIIGTGRVGSTTAFCLAGNEKIDELVLINRTKYKAEGLKMDLMGTLPQRGKNIIIGDLGDANDADIIVITCGEFGAPKGINLFDVNKPIIEELMKSIKPKKNSKMIVTTTPVDKTSFIVLKKSGLDKNRVIGFGGQLDVNRLKYLLFRERSDFSADLEAYYIGEHGGDGIPIFGKKKDENKIVDEARNYYKIHLSKINASTYATASELVKLINALMESDEKEFNVSYFNQKEGIFITWPCMINENGVVRPKDIKLSDEDYKQFNDLIKKRKES